MLTAFTPFQDWLSHPVFASAAGSRFRARVHYAIAPTPYGQALVAISESAIREIALGADDEALVAALKRRFPAAREAKGDPLFWDAGLEVFLAIDAVTLPDDLSADATAPAFEQAVRAQLFTRGGQPARQKLPSLH